MVLNEFRFVRLRKLHKIGVGHGDERSATVNDCFVGLTREYRLALGQHILNLNLPPVLTSQFKPVHSVSSIHEQALVIGSKGEGALRSVTEEKGDLHSVNKALLLQSLNERRPVFRLVRREAEDPVKTIQSLLRLDVIEGEVLNA